MGNRLGHPRAELRNAESTESAEQISVMRAELKEMAMAMQDERKQKLSCIEAFSVATEQLKALRARVLKLETQMSDCRKERNKALSNFNLISNLHQECNLAAFDRTVKNIEATERVSEDPVPEIVAGVGEAVVGTAENIFFGFCK